MFVLTVKALSMIDIKEKLLEASNAIYFPEFNGKLNEIEREPSDREPIYEAPAVQYVPPPVPQAPQVPAMERVYSDPSDVDSNGHPWDDRIHASSRAKTKSGTWRYKRGAEELEIRAIEGKWTSAPTVAPVQVALPAAPPQYTQPPVVVAPPVVASPVSVPNQGVQASTPSASQQVGVASPQYDNIPIPQASTKPAHSLDTFKANFIMTLGGLIREGKLPQEYIEQLKTYFQVKEIWEVVKDESKVTQLFENLCSYGLITKVG